MKNRLLAIPATLSIVALVATGCGEKAKDEIDPDTLARYKAAIPSSSVVSAPIAQANAAFAPGDPAVYPGFVGPIAMSINGSIGALLDLVEAIVQTPPTLYDSAKQEFIWGPFNDDQSSIDGDTVALFIRDKGENVTNEFRYEYALLRGMGNDLASMTPIIYGSGTPDPALADHGSGVLLWDFENAFDFVETNDPGHGPVSRGRFVSVYARGVDTASDTDVTMVVSAFRNFIPEDNPTAPAASADYFYGGLVFPDQNRLDFVDFEFQGDMDDNGSALEDLGVHLALVNGGIGRAEADAVNGDVPAGTTVNVTECWDAALNYQYLAVGTNGNPTPIASEGSSASCFIDTLADVPALEDVDPALMNFLDTLGNNGVPASGGTT